MGATAHRVFPGKTHSSYGGITRIRFNGYDLRLPEGGHPYVMVQR